MCRFCGNVEKVFFKMDIIEKHNYKEYCCCCCSYMYIPPRSKTRDMKAKLKLISTTCLPQKPNRGKNRAILLNTYS